jgi:hypothetical protein
MGHRARNHPRVCVGLGGHGLVVHGLGERAGGREGGDRGYPEGQRAKAVTGAR